MDMNGNPTSTAATDITPAGATVGASPAPEQQGQEHDRATATALSEILSPPMAEDTSGQQATEPIDTASQGDPQTATKAVPRDMRAVEGRHKEDIRRAERDGYNRAMTELEGRFASLMEERLAPYQAMLHQQSVAAIRQQYPNMPQEVAEELAQARASKASASTASQDTPAAQPEQEQQAPASQPRDDKGRFASTQPLSSDEAAMQQRVARKADQLREQASEIHEMYGIDMLGMFKDDEEIKKGIIEQDRDFYWGLSVLDRRKGGARRSPPVVRNPNHTGQAGTSFSDMSSEQFERVQAELRDGRKIDPRR